MATSFYFNNGGTTTDFSDAFIRRDLFSSGGLWLWGTNSSGELGDSTVVNKSSPIQTVAGGTNWKQVAFGDAHTMAIKTDGTLWAWGIGTSGELGDNTLLSKSSPIQTVAGGTNWRQVSCGSSHTGAIKADGTLWLWGYNASYGALGDNTIAGKSSPVQTIAAGSNWRQVSCGGFTTTAIKTDGTLWAWGFNAGQLGDNTGVNKSSPVQTVAGGTNWKQVSCGYNYAAATKTDGTLWLWGSNTYGQLGNSTNTGTSSPIQTISAGTNWKQVACGGDILSGHTAAIKTDGTLWVWGHNTYGQLGDTTITHKSSPVQTVTGGTNWKIVSSGGTNTTAIKTDGTLWVWGYNNAGQLGDNTIVSKSSPVQTVTGGTNWKIVSTGGDNTAAITDIF